MRKTLRQMGSFMYALLVARPVQEAYSPRRWVVRNSIQCHAMPLHGPTCHSLTWHRIIIAWRSAALGGCLFPENHHTLETLAMES